MSTKNEILTGMFLKFWEWDTTPNFDTPETDSIEALVLQVYDNEKKGILASYPWRRAIKYKTLVCEKVSEDESTDGRYEYAVSLPDDFLKEVGFWADSKRGIKLFQTCTVQGDKLLSKREKVTLGYIANIDETMFDVWFEHYFEARLAGNLARIGGQPLDREQYLAQQADAEFIRAKNRDYEMTEKDEVTPSIHQFCEWY